MEFDISQQWNAIAAAPAIYIVGGLAFLAVGYIARGVVFKGALSGMAARCAVLEERLRLANDQLQVVQERKKEFQIQVIDLMKEAD